MKAKLIKTSKDSHHSGHYFLNDDCGFAIGSTDKDWCKRAVKKRPLYILSLSNCQAIELGYDLDELVSNHSNERWKNSDSPSHFNQSACEKDFKAGFQKALELLGDKKFSDEDVILIAEYIRVASQSTPNVRTKELFDEYQSLQQTEWDVEIEMEQVYDGLDEMAQPQYYKQPKLDADGCLILKLTQ